MVKLRYLGVMSMAKFFMMTTLTRGLCMYQVSAMLLKLKAHKIISQITYRCGCFTTQIATKLIRTSPQQIKRMFFYK